MNWKHVLCIVSTAAAGCGDVGQEPLPSQTVQPIVQPEVERPIDSKIPPEERLHYLEIEGGDFGGQLVAGDRIDILAIYEQATESLGPDDPKRAIMTILQNVYVLDVGREGPSALVGVVVTTEELEVLLVSDRGGTLHALLRNPEDVEVTAVRKSTMQGTLGDLEVSREKRQIRATTADVTRTDGGLVAFSASIPLEERAVNLVHGLPDGTLKVGQRVDIHGVFDAIPTGYVALTMLQNVTVLGVHGDRASFAVTADEAHLLLLGSARGRLSFSLRNTEDIEVSHITKKTLREVAEDLEVIQEKRQIRLRRKPKRKRIQKGIEIIRGDSSGVVTVATPEAPPSRANTFIDHGTNPFTSTDEDPFSTFSIDVDTGSYTIARRMIREGTVPPAASVRVEEWLNYFDYGYPEPEAGAFAVSLEAAPSPFQTTGSYRLVRVGVQAKTISESERKPVHLTFLVDTSGSMQSPDKLALVQQSLRHLVRNLRTKDTVALATYAGNTQVLLGPTSVTNRASILRAIDKLSAAGGTAMNDGLSLAYGLAAKNFQKSHENRVIVLSDGDANIGGTTWQAMLDSIEHHVEKGVTLSTIGFGMGNYQDATMEQLANHGNGNYFYVDTEKEARKVFGDQLDGTLQTIAKDVKIQVEFDPNAVRRYRLIGYENRAIADKDFRNDAVDAGEIGAGHSVTALYEVELADEMPPTIATVRVRYKKPRGSKAREAAMTLPSSAVAHRLVDASDSFRFAAAVAAFAELTKKSLYATRVNHDWILEVARSSANGREDRAEFIELVEAANTLY